MKDNREFSEIAEKLKDTVYKVAFNYLFDPPSCDDIVQEVLLKLYLSEKSFESQEHIRNWIIRVCINECKKVLRSPWHKKENIADYENAISYEDPHQTDLMNALAKLDKKYRIVLYLYYYEGYKTDEIAALLGIPSSTVSTRLSRGKKYLKQELEG